MPGRLAARALAVAAVFAAIMACTPNAAPTPSPRVSSTPTPSPPPALRAPADAVLPAVEALALVTRRDHLTAAEYVASQTDQVTGLDEVSSWGWQEASTRQWSGGGLSARAIVLRTDRVDGARRAFATWSEDASAAPFTGGDCPAAFAGLDECREASAGTRAVVVGRLDVEVFRLDLDGLDPGPLAVAQAQRLRAT
jgi:hypothetical protein